MKTHCRRHYYIDKKFQSKIFFLTITLLAFYSLIFVTVLFFPTMSSFSSSSTSPEQVEAARTLLLLHAKVWPAIGISMLILSGLSIFISHRIAGPIYRIRTALAEIFAGDLTTKIRLRKGDDLQEVAEQVNQLKDQLQCFMQALKTQHGELSQQLDELERRRSESGADNEEVRKILLRLNENKERMTETLKQFSR
jgi:methyl-accepting chemotaxis protein